MCRSKTFYPIEVKFCRVVGIPDVITCADFGEDRLRGLGLAGGQTLPFSIEFDRRPYNTPACECVMGLKFGGSAPFLGRGSGILI